MSNIQVKVYSLSTCNHCKSVKQFLTDHEIEYDFVDVDQLMGDKRNMMIDEIKIYNPRCTFPTIVLGDNVVVGNKENEIKEFLNL